MASEPLVQACEVAFEVARRGWESNPPVEPPAPMRSFIYLPQLPRRSMTVAQRVMEEDAQFRSRVAAAATEARVGRAGWLWLHRPPGWEANFSMLTGGSPTAAPPMPMPTNVAPAPMPRVPGPPPPPPPGAGRSSLPAGAAPRPVPRPQPGAPLPAAGSSEARGPVGGPPVGAAASGFASRPVAPDAATGASPAGAGESRESLEAELASLWSLVDRLATERRNVGEALAASPADAPGPAGPMPAPRRDAAPASDDAGTIAERDAARAERDAAQRAQRELEERIVELETGLRRTTEDLATAVAERDAVVAERDAVVVERDAVVAERDAAVAEAVELRAERLRMAETMNRVDQGRSDLEAELADLSSRWQRLQADISQVSKRNSTLEAEVDQLQRVRRSAEAERRGLLNDLALQLARVEAERDLLASQLDVANARLSGTRRALESATQTVGDELDSAEGAVGGSAQAARAIETAVADAGQTLERLISTSEPETTGIVATSADEGAEGQPSDLGVSDSDGSDSGGSDSGGSDESGGFIGVAVDEAPPATPEPTDGLSIDEPGGDGPTVLEPSIFESTDFDSRDFGDESFEGPGFEGPGFGHESFEGPGFDVDRSPGDRGDAPTEESVSDLDQVLAAYGLGASELAVPASAPTGTAPLAAAPPPEPPTPDAVGPRPSTISGGAPLPSPLPEPDGPSTPAVADVAARPAGRVQIAPIDGDPLTVARHTVTTAEVVVLVDGDPVAAMGWPMLSPIERRDALIGNLGDLVGDTGVAVDVVFDVSVAGDEQLPSAPAVRVRLTGPGMEPSSAIAGLVDAYPHQWPVAVVTDDPALATEVRARGASVLDNGQLLDLFIAP